MNMQFRLIIKLGVNKINPNSKGYLKLNEFINLFRYIKIWQRLFFCFKDIDTNEEGDLSLLEFIN